MTDIIDRLRTWCHAPNAASAQDLMDEAADEIRRLRSSMAEQRFCKPPVEGSSPAVGFLTHEERQAVSHFAKEFQGPNAATLRKLLERLTVTNPMPKNIRAEVSYRPSERIYVSSTDTSD